MGIVLGKTPAIEGGLTPAYEVLGTRVGYELRTYPSYVVAEVQASSEPGTDDSCFYILAKYIGAIGAPQNKAAGGESSEAIAMTAPVVTSGPGEKVAMTAPVVTGPASAETASQIDMTAPVVQTLSSSGGAALKTMQFIMPQKYKAVSELPVPTDSRVSLREVPELSYLVHQFSGSMGSNVDAASEQRRVMTEEAVVKDGGAFAEYVTRDAKYVLARYNPPFTLPFLRRNELWFPLPMSKEEIKAKIPAS